MSPGYANGDADRRDGSDMCMRIVDVQLSVKRAQAFPGPFVVRRSRDCLGVCLLCSDCDCGHH
jgi:hypothetical protein